MYLSSFLNENIKHKYVINLDRRRDRYNEFCRHFPSNSNIITRYSAIDGNEISNEIRTINPYVVGCHRSHKNILEQFVKNSTKNDELLLVFEDDVFFSNTTTFSNDFINIISSLKQQNLSKPTLLYIGGRFTNDFLPRYLHKGWEKIDTNLYSKIHKKDIISAENDRTTNVLILNRILAEQILTKTRDIPETQPIDQLYNSLHEYIHDIQVFDRFPHLCYSPANYKSDIQSFRISK